VRYTVQRELVLVYSVLCGGEHISTAGRRTGVRTKTVTPKEGILSIDNRDKVLKANSLYPF
jgi:hypothetical protein